VSAEEKKIVRTTTCIRYTKTFQRSKIMEKKTKERKMLAIVFLSLKEGDWTVI
jgi:hypothetical protein